MGLHGDGKAQVCTYRLTADKGIEHAFPDLFRQRPGGRETGEQPDESCTQFCRQAYRCDGLLDHTPMSGLVGKGEIVHKTTEGGLNVVLVAQGGKLRYLIPAHFFGESSRNVAADSELHVVEAEPPTDPKVVFHLQVAKSPLTTSDDHLRFLSCRTRRSALSVRPRRWPLVRR